MIRRVTDSVEISYRFHGDDGRELRTPALYSLGVNTGRDSWFSRSEPVPDVDPITELVEAYRQEYTTYRQADEAYRQEREAITRPIARGHCDVSPLRAYREGYKDVDSLLADKRLGVDKHLHRCSDLEKSIERELLNYFGRPEFIKGSHQGRYYAVLKNSFWSSTRNLTEEEWRALIARALAREEARLATYVNNSSPKISKREFIPDSVRVAVWRRDEAKCVRCGSNERLEFDHIIPVALGGSSTARNIQLLCEPCNRTKSASIGKRLVNTCCEW